MTPQIIKKKIKSSASNIWFIFLFLITLPSIFFCNETQIHPKQGNLFIPEFKLHGGGNISPLHIHYQTLGTPRRDAEGHITNAVLLLHPTGGTGSTFLTPNFVQSLYGREKPLDLNYFFIVMPDCIGSGGSSKPSDGDYGKFPQFGYIDQIEAIHAMLQSLGILKERLVMGISMGGMLTWLWGEYYSNETDALVAIGSTPSQIAGRNLLWRQIIIEAIVNDPNWNNGQPDPKRPMRKWSQTAGPLLMVMTENPERILTSAPTREATLKLFDESIKKIETTVNPYDMLYMYRSSFDYDPKPNLERITAPFLSINFIDDLVNPPELLHIPKQSNFQAVMLVKEADLFGHKGIFHPEGWANDLAIFLNQMEFRKKSNQIPASFPHFLHVVF